MGFTLADRVGGRWPNRRVPFEVNREAFPDGSAARTAITNAINAWNATGVVTLSPRQGEVAFLLFGPAVGNCQSEVGFTGRVQTISCALAIDPIATPGAATEIALIKQTDSVLTAALLDTTGTMRVAWVTDDGYWFLPIRVEGNPGVPDGRVTLAKQTDDILTAVFIDAGGFLSVAHVVGTGAWNPTVRVGGAVGPPGARVSLIKQTDDILTAVFIDAGGFFSVAHVVGTGAWNPPVRVGGAVGTPGAPVALAKQTDDILTAVFIDRGGFLSVAHVVGTGRWNPPVRVAPAVGGAVGTPGAPVALAKQTDDILTAVFIDAGGFFSVAHVVGTGAWNPPVRVGGAVGTPGAPVALAKQTDDILTAMFVDQTGIVSVAHVVETNPWNPPAQLGGNQATPGAPVTLAKQTDDILTGTFVDVNGRFCITYVVGTSAWSAPGPIRSGGFNSGNIMHEIGHALGLLHEHQRPDRNNFVAINLANALADKASEFAIDNSGLPVGAYDCGSIMHYGPNAHQRPGAPGPTIMIVPDAACANIGQRVRPSPGDVAAVNSLYVGTTAPPGAPGALSRQLEDILTAVFVDSNGVFSVAHVVETGVWNPPVTVGTTTGAPAAGVALARQTPEILTAAFINGAGVLSIAHVVDTEPWKPPFTVGGPVGRPA